MQTFTIKSNHPCLAGHFPNNPIVPGAVIIDEVVQNIQSQKPNIHSLELVNVKFIQPLKSDTKVQIVWKTKDHNLWQFSCITDDLVITRGLIKITNE